MYPTNEMASWLRSQWKVFLISSIYNILTISFRTHFTRRCLEILISKFIYVRKMAEIARNNSLGQKKNILKKKDNLQEYIPHLKAETTMLENKDFHFLSQEILNIMVV